MQYRADIDGLRAIAVLSVVVFHFIASALPNGFLGVDIFFVISGFLIKHYSQIVPREKILFKRILHTQDQTLIPCIYMRVSLLLSSRLYFIPAQ